MVGIIIMLKNDSIKKTSKHTMNDIFLEKNERL